MFIFVKKMDLRSKFFGYLILYKQCQGGEIWMTMKKRSQECA